MGSSASAAGVSEPPRVLPPTPKTRAGTAWVSLTALIPRLPLSVLRDRRHRASRLAYTCARSGGAFAPSAARGGVPRPQGHGRAGRIAAPRRESADGLEFLRSHRTGPSRRVGPSAHGSGGFEWHSVLTQGGE